MTMTYDTLTFLALCERRGRAQAHAHRMFSRAQFRVQGGLDRLVPLLKSYNEEVRRNASWALNIVIADETAAKTVCALGFVHRPTVHTDVQYSRVQYSVHLRLHFDLTSSSTVLSLSAEGCRFCTSRCRARRAAVASRRSHSKSSSTTT